MNWGLWWVFASTSLALDATPGPAVLLVMATSLRHGCRAAVGTILGILGANAFYFAISATSVGPLLLASYDLFFLVKWIGSAYLMWLGWKALRSRASVFEGVAVAASSRLFVDGFVSQMANPNALVYFAAFVPQFLDGAFPVAPQLLRLGATNTFCEFFVLAAYGGFAGRATELLRQDGYAVWANRITGVVLLGAGGWMALLRR